MSARHLPTAPVAVPLAALLLAVTTAASPAPLAAQEVTAEAAVPSYGVRPGDRVITRFFSGAGEEQRAIAGERTVDREGQIFYPFIGPVDVVGLDATEIRQELERRYASYYSNAVVDVVVELRVNVTGAVRSPGNFFLNPSSTLVDALAEAGGSGLDLAVTAQHLPADPSEVRLLRDGEITILDLRPDHARHDVLDMRVQSGDWLYVPPRERSRIRDEVTFWGSLVSFAASVVGLVILLGR